MEKNVKKVKWYQKIGVNIFAKFFGFEQGIDITDDIAVLHRRNIVIKNIIFISNLFYSLLLLILSLSTGLTADWVVTVITLPLTFLINKLLKNLIALDKSDKTKQMIAMYVASFYIFTSSVLVYIKLINHPSFETVAYVLIYYALVVISLYQYKSLLRNAFIYLFGLLTIIHLVWTYSLVQASEGFNGLWDFLKYFVTTKDNNDFGDLILRSLIFGLFYLTLYVIISIGEYMQNERKKELEKRRQVQDDFAVIVGDLFNAVFINAYISVSVEDANKVADLTKKMASLMGYNEIAINNLVNFSLIHLKYEEIKGFKLGRSYDDNVYEELKEKSTLGARIVKRMELSQNVDTIVRAFVDSNYDEENIKAIIIAHSDLNSQIILLAEIFYTLRKQAPYKRPYPFKTTIEIINQYIAPFFDETLMNRFNKFTDEIEEVYNTFK